MRTTITLDEDIVRELKARSKHSDKSFKQVLNDSLRLAFSISRSPIRKMKPFRVRPHSSAFRPGVDFEKLNQLVDQLDVEERLRPARKGAPRR